MEQPDVVTGFLVNFLDAAGYGRRESQWVNVYQKVIGDMLLRVHIITSAIVIM